MRRSNGIEKKIINSITRVIVFLGFIPLLLLAFDSSTKAVEGETPSLFVSRFVNSLDGRDFYRTRFAQGASPFYARHKIVPQGVYDELSNKTYLVYPAGTVEEEVPSNNETYLFSALDPYIVAYDHKDGNWEGPVRISSIEQRRDPHHYPQIVVDNQGYLHVFQSFHNSNKNIFHAKSKSPGDITEWNISEIPQTSKNTYVAAFKDNQGEIYLFYRSHEYVGVPSIPQECKDAAESKNETDLSRYCKYYLPELYVKSSDNGTTWTSPRHLIDPGRPSGVTGFTVVSEPNDTGWTVVYTKDFLSDKVKNGVHITFGLHRYFGITGESGNQYYFFFNFNNDNVYSVRGDNLGPTLKGFHYEDESCCSIYQAPSIDERQIQGSYSTKQAIVIEDEINHYPTIYYNQWYSNINNPNDPNYYRDGRNRVFKARWDGQGWQTEDLSDVFGMHIKMLDAEYNSNTGTDVYMRIEEDGNQPAVLFNYDSLYGWRRINLFNDDYNLERGAVWDLSVVANHHPDIKATFVIPKRTDQMNTPTLNSDCCNYAFPIGSHYIWGEGVLGNQSYTIGDINKDDVVDIQDYILLSNAFGTSNQQSDLNEDGIVDIQDYIILSNNFGVVSLY